MDIDKAGVGGGWGGENARRAGDIGICDDEEVIEAIGVEGDGADAEEIEIEGAGKEGVSLCGAERFEGVIGRFLHG